ncbi:MAG: ATP synthase F0 subunit B [Proteobacteria bacterium]|nr:ATP synthase F0 subunit B [Pseudomonadota bacterium]MCP4918663.1 ATP synthase F0 subunit B [Pseudomonadota bacterium]
MLTSPLLLVSDAWAGGGLVIFPDVPLTLLQLVPFLVVMAILTKLIFQPMVQYLDDREKATTGAHEHAALLTQQADEKQAEYDQKLAAAKSELSDLRAQKRAEIHAERDAAVAAARVKTDARFAEALTAIQAEQDLAAAELGKLTDALSSDITTAVLGRGAEA